MLKKSKYQIYSVHGINIESAICLPDLLKTNLTPDVKIGFGELTKDFLAKHLGETKLFERPGCRTHVSAQGDMLLEWDLVGRFLVRGGNQVIVEPEPETQEADLQPFLTGPVLSVLLHQRGYLVLHASAVVISGAATAFLGAKGFGKSTLAASMQVRGHQLISDDAVPISFENDRITTFPGYPKIKLFPDSVEAVGKIPKHLPLIHRWVEKHSFQCAENFQMEPVSLSGIYILAQGDEVKIKRLDLKSAFIEIVRYSHLSRYLEALNCRKQHFEQCQKLVRTIPVFELRRPHRFDKIAETASLLESNAVQIGGTNNFSLAV